MLESQDRIDMPTVHTVNTVDMGRPKKHEGRKAITVYLSESEYKWVVLQAPGNVSQWVHDLIAKQMVIHDHFDKLASDSPKEEVRASVEKVAALSKTKKPVRTCTHGVEKGYHCWQCRGLANVE